MYCEFPLCDGKQPDVKFFCHGRPPDGQYTTYNWKFYGSATSLERPGYFYRAKRGKQYFSYLTNLELCDSKYLYDMEWFIMWIESTARDLSNQAEFKKRLPKDVEVVLATEKTGEGAYIWHYYMADISSQSIFYFHELPPLSNSKKYTFKENLKINCTSDFKHSIFDSKLLNNSNRLFARH